MKILVTGASGYVGSFLVEHYLSLGSDVIGIDKLPSKTQHLNYQHIVLELSEDLHLFDEILIDFAPKVVIHSAALVPLTKNYTSFRSVNSNLPAALYRSCCSLGVDHFIHISSSAVFTPEEDGSIQTDAPLSPIEPYGRSKALGETNLLAAKAEMSTKLSIVRPRTIIGGFRGGIISLLFSWLERDLPLFLIGKGDRPFQFIEIYDLIGAIQTIQSEGIEGTFNIGTTDYGSLEELYKSMVRLTGSNSRIRRLPEFGVPTILWAMEKLRVSPLGPWHYRTYSKGYYFEQSGLEGTDWRPAKSNLEMFMDAWNHRAISEGSDTGSKHSTPLKWRLIDVFLWIMK